MTQKLRRRKRRRARESQYRSNLGLDLYFVNLGWLLAWYWHCLFQYGVVDISPSLGKGTLLCALIWLVSQIFAMPRVLLCYYTLCDMCMILVLVVQIMQLLLENAHFAMLILFPSSSASHSGTPSLRSVLIS